MTRQKPFGQTIIKDKNGKPVKALTQGQYELVQAIEEYDILFVNGPAGTGKTFLATCKAVAGLQDGTYERLCLSRPAVETGEGLGFLPGDLNDKIAPYMRPLYDSIDKLKPKPRKVVTPQTGKGKRKRGPQDTQDVQIEEVEWAKNIEINPLEYMRGLTMENSFIILDEAQNVTSEQMKMLLTRMGWGSKVVITGDASQCDLDRRVNSGFRHAQQLLKGVDGIGFVQLDEHDIVRHKLVKDIIKRYEKEDSYRTKVYSNRDRYSNVDFEPVPDEYIESEPETAEA